MGSRYKPFATGGDPSQSRFLVEGIVAQGITNQQQRERRELLNKLNALEHTLPDNAAMKALTRSEDQAYDMILGDGRAGPLTSDFDRPTPGSVRPLSRVAVSQWVVLTDAVDHSLVGGVDGQNVAVERDIAVPTTRS